MVKGTKMAFAGLKAEEDRHAVIAYIEANGGEALSRLAALASGCACPRMRAAMTLNPPDLRPDRAPRAAARRPARPGQPSIGMVSLGCPKALVDSERILTRLRAEGYAISPDYQGADAVIVNTCGFLDSAKAESLEAIGEALAENGRVIVTGCLGADEPTTSAAPIPRCSR